MRTHANLAATGSSVSLHSIEIARIIPR